MSNCLTDQENGILMDYFGGNGTPKSLDEIAAERDMTVQQVLEVGQNGIDKINRRLKSKS